MGRGAQTGNDMEWDEPGFYFQTLTSHYVGELEIELEMMNG